MDERKLKKNRKSERITEIDQIFAFCMNKDTCKRHMLLKHLNDVLYYKYDEILDCNKHCDNCYETFRVEMMDPEDQATNSLTLLTVIYDAPTDVPV